MPHRKDIDGLRAIAVLAVVFYHLGLIPGLTGGFVGVDVFFVISGYLITGILRNEIDAGELSIAEFYHRRVRRIFPALFVVHLFCLFGSALLLFPAEAKSVGWDVLASLGFLSNVVFARAGGYFDQASKVAPLLHTWSLSVEEQFYIVLPLLLWGLSRLGPRWRVGILAALGLLSLLASQHMVKVDARRAFYFVQYRAWELLAGALLALGALPRFKNRVLAEVTGGVGLALLATALFVIGDTTPFPGYWALLPCLGAMAILHSGADVVTLVARTLSLAPLRWIGLISYSLYLWHWPVIALYNARHESMSGGVRVIILGATLLISFISYRYVESPFRRKPYRYGARSALLVGAAGMAAIASLAVGIPAATARLRTQSELADIALSYLNYSADVGAPSCFLHSGYEDWTLFNKDVCLKTASGKKNLLIMGDSHAAHFVPAFRALRPELNVLQATASGCQPVRGGAGAKRCTRLFSYVFDEFLSTHRVDTVVLAGRWPRSELRDLKNTIRFLEPLVGRVIVLGPVVEYDQPFPKLLARSVVDHDPELPARHLVPAQRAADRLFARQLAPLAAEYFSVYQATCPGDQCTQWASAAVPMHYDAHHFTLRGAELVLERLGPQLFR